MMGLLPRIPDRRFPLREPAYRDEDGRTRAGIAYDRFADVLGGRLVSLLRPNLDLALGESLPDRGELRFDCELTAVRNRDDGVTVGLGDGETVDADLLVRRDRIHSAVRRLGFDDDVRVLRHLGLHTAGFLFADREVHDRLDSEFALTDTAHLAMGFYGLVGARVAVFAVHRRSDPTPPDDARAALRAEYSLLGWVAPRALAARPASEQVSYDQVARIVLPAWSRRLVALAGDSCGAMSLLAGQGASLAVAGGYLLAERLARSGATAAAPAGYEHSLHPLVTGMQQAARRGLRWLLPPGPRDLFLRRLALTLARLPALNRSVAEAVIDKPTGREPIRGRGRPGSSILDLTREP